MRLIWSRLAKAELAEIRSYSLHTWGQSVAIRYMHELREAARASPRIRPGLTASGTVAHYAILIALLGLPLR